MDMNGAQFRSSRRLRKAKQGVEPDAALQSKKLDDYRMDFKSHLTPNPWLHWSFCDLAKLKKKKKKIEALQPH